MPKISTALTGAAGEHFIAYKLSAMGYPVALTRGGSPTIDLMVGSLTGIKTLSIQVKTSRWAWRQFTRKTENNHWEWDVGAKALDLRGDSIFYAFVDLKWNDSEPALPDVFIVPSVDVANTLKPNDSRFMFWIRKAEECKCREKWSTLIDYLESGRI